MTQDEKYQYWFDCAKYDLDTAEAVFSSADGSMLYLCVSRQWKNW
jgi:hypothetical protein